MAFKSGAGAEKGNRSGGILHVVVNAWLRREAIQVHCRQRQAAIYTATWFTPVVGGLLQNPAQAHLQLATHWTGQTHRTCFPARMLSAELLSLKDTAATGKGTQRMRLQIRRAVHAAPRMLCQQMDSAAAAHLDYLASLGITQGGFVTMISRQACWTLLSGCHVSRMTRLDCGLSSWQHPHGAGRTASWLVLACSTALVSLGAQEQEQFWAVCNMCDCLTRS